MEAALDGAEPGVDDRLTERMHCVLDQVARFHRGDAALLGRDADFVDTLILGTRLAERDYFGRRLARPGLAPTAGIMHVLTLVWAKVLGMKATALWASERGVPEITLESSWRQTDRETRVRAHVDLVRVVVGELERL